MAARGTPGYFCGLVLLVFVLDGVYNRDDSNHLSSIFGQARFLESGSLRRTPFAHSNTEPRAARTKTNPLCPHGKS